MIKIIYRYINVDTELRNIFAQSNTLADFRNACQYLRNQLAHKSAKEIEDGEKELVSWYNRYRFPGNKLAEAGDDGDNYTSSTKYNTPKPPFSALDESALEDAFNMFQC